MDSEVFSSNPETSSFAMCPPPSTPIPLQHISPNRIHEPRIPQSPSLHSYLAENERPKHRDSVSDVQSKITFLNSLSNPSSPTRAPRFPTTPARRTAIHDAAMNYEESQATVASLNAELDRARQELAAGQRRERMVSERVEALMDQLDRQGEKIKSDRAKYVQEMKRLKGENFKAEKMRIEADQGTNGMKAQLKRLAHEVEREREEKEKARQEAFDRAYALAGMVEEMEVLRGKLRAVETERDSAVVEARSAVKLPAPKEDREVEMEDGGVDQETIKPRPVQIAEVVVEMVQQPPTAYASTDLGAPASYQPLDPFEALKLSQAYMDKQVAGEKITLEEELAHLKQELFYVNRLRQEDQEAIHFMQMECQFKACACRRAEAKGERFVHDHVYDAKVQQEQRASKKRKISDDNDYNEKKEETPAEVEPRQEEQQQDVKMESETDVQEGAPTHTDDREAKDEAAQLPPSENTGSISSASESSLMEAMEVPLPPPEQMEIEALDRTPEPTAQLEDITQVIVEPGPASKPFTFSTSTSANPTFKASTSSSAATAAVAPLLLPRAESAMARTSLTQDLFDLSPPKQSLRPRPSTSMGLLTTESPIRLVPNSPQPPTVDDTMHAATDHHHHAFAESTTTTKVALKMHSPERSSVHRRAPSRPNLSAQSPLASVMTQDQDFSARDTSASPAASTLFPVTPLHKPSRSMHGLQTTTTTTRVPLRDTNTEFDHVPDPRSFQRPRTSQAVRSSRAFLDDDDDDDVDVAAAPADRNATETISARPTFSLSHHRGEAHTGLVGAAVPAGAAVGAGDSILGNVPGTPISREAALAQIRARRDRARSVNLKKEAAREKERDRDRDRSPVKVKGKSGGAGAALFARDGARREISQASAPGRFGS